MRNLITVTLLGLVACSSSGPRPFGHVDHDALERFSERCPAKIVHFTEETAKTAEVGLVAVPADVTVKKPAHLNCLATFTANNNSMAADLFVDEEDGSVLGGYVDTFLPVENFDRNLDALIASTMDPWVKVATHAELVRIAKQPHEHYGTLRGPRWQITAYTHNSDLGNEVSINVAVTPN